VTIGDRHRLARVVDEELFARRVLKAHHRILSPERFNAWVRSSNAA